MAQQTDIDVSPPQAPVLLFPKEEAVVNGKSVPFLWEHEGEADAFQMQVATGPNFEHIVYEKRFEPEAIGVNVTNLFPTDGTTFYWRILVHGAGGWSHGEVIDSFLAVDPKRAAELVTLPSRMGALGPYMELVPGDNETVLYLRNKEIVLHEVLPAGMAGHDLKPDWREGFGPISELFRAASMEVAAEVSDEYRRDAAEAGVEREGIAAGQILGIALALAIAVGMVVVLATQWIFFEQEVQRERVAGISGYPELRNAEAAELQRLNQYDVVDPEAGLYRIPIDEAMEMMIREERQQARPYSAEWPGGAPAPSN